MVALPYSQENEKYQLTNNLMGQQPRPIVAGELSQKSGRCTTWIDRVT
jgi:hypothetical protein